MPRGRKAKSKINPLVEHIADFSDMEFDDDDEADIVKKRKMEKIDNETYDDESDKTWMYKDKNTEDMESGSDNIEDMTDEDIWGNEPEEQKNDTSVGEHIIEHGSKIDKYMTAAVWFNEISNRGNITKEESRYVELMIIELSKFYFGHLDIIKLSKKCQEAINNICKNILEAQKCSGY